MPGRDTPSNADLVYDVLRSAAQPLTFREIFDAVNSRRPITTRNPEGTVRTAIGQGKQLVSLGGGRYGYLPNLLSGSLVRVSLTEQQPAEHPLIYCDDARQALWPSFFENQKHRSFRPVVATLPDRREASLSLDFFGPGEWGSNLPPELHDFLVESKAAAGDALLIRVTEGDAGRAEAWLEREGERDSAAVQRHNQELSDMALAFMGRTPRREVMIWDVVIALLARGAYRGQVAADPLTTVLASDRRFIDAGLGMWLLADAVTPDVVALIRLRKQHEPELLEQGKQIEQEIRLTDEANAPLAQTKAAAQLPHGTSQTALQKAQELIYDAWETDSARQRVRMARKALQLSPDCADAWVLLAEDTARSAAQAAELYAQGVAAGERALGAQAFVQEVGHFWLVLETRPYMRARFGLADTLWHMAKRKEAIAHLRDMLRLNPGDNQGLRYILLGWLLEVGDNAQVKKLLDAYGDEPTAAWLYGRALHDFRSYGDSQRARKLLAKAYRFNHFVPAYLLGRKPMPSPLPATFSFGDESEAIACADEQMTAWRGTPRALVWLEANVARRSSS